MWSSPGIYAIPDYTKNLKQWLTNISHFVMYEAHCTPIQGDKVMQRIITGKPQHFYNRGSQSNLWAPRLLH